MTPLPCPTRYRALTVISLDALTSLRGSLIVLRRRCGKPNCHCAKGRPHCTPALSFSLKGKTRIITLTEDELPAVRRALQHYSQAQALADAEAAKGIRLLERYRRQARKG